MPPGSRIPTTKESNNHGYLRLQEPRHYRVQGTGQRRNGDHAVFPYHNLDNGFAAGYQHNGFGAGLPATLVTALLGGTDSQGVIPGVPWNPDSEKLALEAVQKAGWTPISADQLGYAGKVDGRGTFFGEKAGYTTAQVEILGKYDAEGHLQEIGVSFRGTSGPRENLIGDSIGDVINDLMAALGPKDYAKNYVGEAFGNLLGDVAKFAQAHGLTGNDVLVSGHSLGGLAVNSLADLSASKWSGFYSSANYIAYASPTQSSTDKVLNIGYENDPVFRALDGSTFNLASVGVHDGQQESATNNIVSFNDHYGFDCMERVAVFHSQHPHLDFPSAYRLWRWHGPDHGLGVLRPHRKRLHHHRRQPLGPCARQYLGARPQPQCWKPTPAARSSSAATAMT